MWLPVEAKPVEVPGAPLSSDDIEDIGLNIDELWADGGEGQVGIRKELIKYVAMAQFEKHVTVAKSQGYFLNGKIAGGIYVDPTEKNTYLAQALWTFVDNVAVANDCWEFFSGNGIESKHPAPKMDKPIKTFGRIAIETHLKQYSNETYMPENLHHALVEIVVGLAERVLNAEFKTNPKLLPIDVVYQSLDLVNKGPDKYDNVYDAVLALQLSEAFPDIAENSNISKHLGNFYNGTGNMNHLMLLPVQALENENIMAANMVMSLINTTGQNMVLSAIVRQFREAQAALRQDMAMSITPGVTPSALLATSSGGAMFPIDIGSLPFSFMNKQFPPP